ncbi:MAG: hypothetical protein PHW33_00140 [Candidatus Portnoybacteria bacterium]|jgi:hypothetical protein|nr:hypothetical protein [Candidatus Portnoybacteria bacterium]
MNWVVEVKQKCFLAMAVFIGIGCLAIVNVGYMALRAYWLGFEGVSSLSVLVGFVIMILGVFLFCFLAIFFRKRMADLDSGRLPLLLFLSAALLFFVFSSEIKEGVDSLIRRVWLEAGFILAFGLAIMGGVFSRSKPLKKFFSY